MRRDADRSLESRLADLATAIELPATPPLRDAVLERVRAGAPASARPGLRRRAALIAIALLAALGASLAVPQWRDVVAGWLGLRGVTIQQRPGALPALPAVPATPSPPGPATPAPPGSSLHLGDPTTVEAAASQLGFAPLAPSILGAPDAAWLRQPPSGGALSLVYLPRSGRPPDQGTGVSVLVTEFRASLDVAFLGKFVAGDGTISQVSIGGEPGVWIAGAPHHVGFRDADGNLVDDTLRLATNTLLWQHGSLLVRIEGAQSLDAALALAASMG